ncbi:MAG TPA: type II secretion system protein [Blastocatellia bacterium]|nr:type II secretion system protein [Blastocatellia bacterium]
MKKASGFSLLELISVVSIVAVASAVMMPSVLKAIQSYRLRTAAQQVEDALHSAKFAAIQSNATRKAYINTSTRCVSFGSSTSGTQYPLPSGISFTSISVTPPSIVSTAVANATSIGGQQGTNASALTSFPATTGATNFYEVSFNSRGLPGPGINAGTIHWVYLTNSNNELMAVTITSAGSSQVWRWTGSAWIKL